MSDYLKKYALLWVLGCTQAAFLILKTFGLMDLAWKWVLAPSWALPVLLLILYGILIVWGSYQGLRHTKKPG